MKLKLYTVFSLVAVIGIASCAEDNNKEYVDKSIMPTAEEKAAAEQKAAVNTATVPANTAMPVNMPANMQPQQGSPVTIPGGKPVMVNPQAQQNNMVMTPVQPTAPGMNPPHGQPGHRCDISVGAPLNSKPAPAPATTTGATVNAQPLVTMKQVPTTTKTAPGMNPPHGEPNHRCDIAVGAPLNSKPAPAPATTTGTTVSAQPQVTMKDVAATTKTAPGMNPPHGEPNHRCDIAVGAPLYSKPAAAPPLLSTPKPDSTKN